MKKRILSLILLSCALGAVSCNPDKPNEPCTEHVDADHNGSCDVCGESVEVTHVDANNDGKCDVCGATVEVIDDGIKYNTIKELISLAPSESGTTSTERYYVKAKVKSIDNATYGQMTIEDETGTMSVYGTYSSDGVLRYSEMDDKPFAGDDVTLYGNLKNYNGEIEINSGWIIEFKHNEVEVKEDDYTKMTTAEVRTASKGALCDVSGTVAAITYANGMKPNGFILVDQTGAIYVYDSQITPRVEKGNKVRILASKDKFVLEKEKTYADQFGYLGATQLTNAVLKENDNKINEIDLSAAENKTIKEIINTPCTTDLTSGMFTTTALIKKSEGVGFTNYYFDDIDGKTGTYAYTQCNGSDYSWLDEFDGELHTVTLIVLNAKSTASGCNWRFVPIFVDNEVKTFNLDETANYLVEYHGKDQFKELYTGDPMLEVVTSVDSELLGFTNGTLAYSSSTPSVADFVEENGKLIFHTFDSGTTTITITGSLEGHPSYSETLNIQVTLPKQVNAITVKEAIDHDVQGDQESLLVRGIIGPSLVNQTGFYLIDNTGAIAVRLNDKTIFNDISFGQDVVIKGQRNLWGNSNTQICLSSATVEVNFEGKYDYSTASFITDKTLADVKALDKSELIHTAEVYVVNAKVKAASGYGTPSLYTDDGTTFELYASGAAQYSWINDYIDENTYEFEVAPCNWNSKNFFKGCILSVKDASGNKVVNTLNFVK